MPYMPPLLSKKFGAFHRRSFKKNFFNKLLPVLKVGEERNV